MSNNIPTIGVMVDLETFGTIAGSVILSIGACTFDSEFESSNFYEKINVESSLEAGFIIEDNTIQWWEEQSKEVFETATSGTKSLNEVLKEFSDWMKELPGRPVIYGNGSNFDNAMLEYAYKKLEMEVPWKYRDSRCFRTLKNLFPKVKYVKPEISHDALSDAISQSEQATQIMNIAKIANRDLELMELIGKLTDDDLVQLKEIIKEVLED